MRSSGASARSASAASEAAPSPFVRRDRSGGGARRLRQLLGVPETLTSREQLLLVAGRHPLCCSDERLQLRETRRDRIGVARELLVPAPRRDQLAPGELRLASPLGLLGTAERVEHVELERRTREPALLELPRHGDEPLRRSGHVFPRDGASPRIRARPPVAEDAPRDDEPSLSFGTQLGERSELLVVEEPIGDIQLGLDVCLGPVGADRGGIGACPEQEPDRLREDRLPRPRFPRHRVEAGRERQLGLADENEVLDAEPTKQSSGGSGARRSPPGASREASARLRCGRPRGPPFPAWIRDGRRRARLPRRPPSGSTR